MNAPTYSDLESHTNQKYSQFSEQQQTANLNTQQQIPNQIPYQHVYAPPIATNSHNPPMQNYQPPTQIYNQPMPTPYHTSYMPHMNAPMYAPTMQHTSTNNVIVVQQNPNPILIERNAPSNNADYPVLQVGLALAILILNIFLPGIGTIVMGCVGNNSASWICIGICQMFLVFLVIGWIWAIITGIMCVSYSRN